MSKGTEFTNISKILTDEEEVLFNNYDKIQLVKQLAFFKNLERIGNVYYQSIPDSCSTMIELLEIASGYDAPTLKELLNLCFVKNDKSQTRCIEKYNKHSNLMGLAKYLSNEYSRQNAGAMPPRIKTSKSTEEILSCRSGLKNYYPTHYVVYIKIFLKNHPLNTWHLKYTGCVIDGFENLNNGSYNCLKCEITLKKNSRRTHKKMCDLRI